MRDTILCPLLALACAALAACGASTPPPPPAPTVAAARPLQQSLVDWDDYDGQFQAVDSVDVRPRVSGYLRSIGFKDGDVVREGQVLFIIDPRPYQAALDQAKGQEAHAVAARADALTQLARGKTLLAAHAVSQQAYDTLQATARQTDADLVSARAAVQASALNLAFTRVTAPLGGRISDRRVAAGNLVTADITVLTNIVSLNPIRFAFTGSESLYLKYQRLNLSGGRPSSRQSPTPVEIRLQDEQAYRWKGRMDFVDNALDTSSGTIRGRAIVENPDDFLTPGMFGHLRLLGSAPYPALLVPDQATATDQTRQVVYVVDTHGKVAQRLVTLGPLYEGLRVIRTGLTANDLVVISGVQRLKTGATVRASMQRLILRPAPEPALSAGYTAPEPTGAADAALAAQLRADRRTLVR
jgi:RND family efflux transporter MFP subunit